MHSCVPIIRLCRHVLPSGRRCQQPAVGRRSCCRHHLDAQARLHNMARARRCSTVLRFRTALTPHDLAWNEAEVGRVLATERLDGNVARMMLWALDLSASALRAKDALGRLRVGNDASNLNEIYDVPVSRLFSRSLSTNLSEIIENTHSCKEGLAKSERRRANREQRLPRHL